MQDEDVYAKVFSSDLTSLRELNAELQVDCNHWLSIWLELPRQELEQRLETPFGSHLLDCTGQTKEEVLERHAREVWLVRFFDLFKSWIEAGDSPPRLFLGEFILKSGVNPPLWFTHALINVDNKKLRSRGGDHQFTTMKIRLKTAALQALAEKHKTWSQVQRGDIRELISGFIPNQERNIYRDVNSITEHLGRTKDWHENCLSLLIYCLNSDPDPTIHVDVDQWLKYLEKASSK